MFLWVWMNCWSLSTKLGRRNQQTQHVLFAVTFHLKEVFYTVLVVSDLPAAAHFSKSNGDAN